MKFGQLENSHLVDFSFKDSPPETIQLLQKNKHPNPLSITVGLPKFNKKDLKEIYPPKVSDDLAYYSSRYKSIEFNATFYKTPSKEQVFKWKEKTPDSFKFFPKIPQSISHYSRLLNTKEKVLAYCDAIALFEDKLGLSFLQMHDNYKLKDLDRLLQFIADYPIGYPLAIELRNESWFENPSLVQPLYEAMQQKAISTVLIDTPGRRDVLHMRLTSPIAFIRFVSAQDEQIDKSRLDQWITRLQYWESLGLEQAHIFIHQPYGTGIPVLSDYLISRVKACFPHAY